MDLLLRLAAESGKTVSRDDILRDVWNSAPGADASLTVAISRLRQALADDRAEPRFIKTLPKRGYRLLVTPRYPAAAASHARQLLWTAALVLVVVATLPVVYWQFRQSNSPGTVHAGAGGTQPVIAVLPFRDMSPQQSHDYLGEGIADELITRLAQVPGLQVIARTSSFSFRGKRLDAHTIAHRLGANLVIEGSVVEAQPRVRVRVQLINAAGRHLWARSYDRPLASLLALQDEVSQEVIQSLQHRRAIPSVQVPKLSGMTTNNAAYLAYIQARYHLNRSGAAEILQSIKLFRKAVALDPKFARAYEDLSVAYSLMTYWGKDRSRYPEYEKLSRIAAQRALALDSSLAVAYLMSTNDDNELEKTHQWEKFVRRYQHALDLEPDNPRLHFWHASLLRDLGYEKAAAKESSLALRRDPYSAIRNYVVGWSYYLSGQPDLALQYALQTRALGATGRFVVAARVYAEQGEYTQAQKILSAPAGGYGHDAEWMALVFSAMQHPEKKPAALKKIAAAQAIGLARIDSFAAFDSYAYLSETDLALDALQLATAPDYGGPPDYFHMWAPVFARVRSTRRFHDLMMHIGLADYWRRHGWPDYCKPVKEDFRCF